MSDRDVIHVQRELNQQRDTRDSKSIARSGQQRRRATQYAREIFYFAISYIFIFIFYL